MSRKGNMKKAEQLGMAIGTASNRLRKKILFSLIQETNKDTCFQCGEKIETVDDLSIEHKVPWLDSESPVELFFDLDNISFSHLVCNLRAGKKGYSRKHFSIPHGTITGYKNYNCRCSECRKINASYEHTRRGCS